MLARLFEIFEIFRKIVFSTTKSNDCSCTFDEQEAARTREHRTQRMDSRWRSDDESVTGKKTQCQRHPRRRSRSRNVAGKQVPSDRSPDRCNFATGKGNSCVLLPPREPVIFTRHVIHAIVAMEKKRTSSSRNCSERSYIKILRQTAVMSPRALARMYVRTYICVLECVGTRVGNYALASDATQSRFVAVTRLNAPIVRAVLFRCSPFATVLRRLLRGGSFLA